VVKIDAGSLPRGPNLHWLGSKGYEELPKYLSGWDAAFMPFAMNESTRYISPTKTPEFLCAAVPVVSTAVADVVKPYGAENLVEIGRTAEEMSAAIDRLLRQDREPWLRRVNAKLANMSWDKTWAEMDALINARLRKRGQMVRREVTTGEAITRV